MTPLCRRELHTTLCQLAGQLLPNFETSIPLLMIHLDDDKLQAYIDALKRLVKRPIGDPQRQQASMKLRVLLASKSCLWNVDTHPLGCELSSRLIGGKMQHLLNHKRIKVGTERQQATQQMPKVELTRLYTNVNLMWVRVCIDPHHPELACGIEEALTPEVQCHYASQCQLTSTIWEIYFHPKIPTVARRLKPQRLVAECETTLWIRRIVFVSDCRLFKEACSAAELSQCLSNTFKFYYCYLNQVNDALILQPAHLATLLDIYTLSVMLTYKSNLQMYEDAERGGEPNVSTTTPLSALSGFNPQRLVYGRIESLTTNKTEGGMLDDFGDTHRVHTLTTDRDRRTMGLSSTMGGLNVHELIFHDMKRKQ